MKGAIVVLCAWTAFYFTTRVGVWHSGKEEATIGIITYHGLPFPWAETAPGLARGIKHFWILPINLAVWTVGSCLLWRVKTWRGFVWGLAVAELPVLSFVLPIYF
jgi:hypothetical protein